MYIPVERLDKQMSANGAPVMKEFFKRPRVIAVVVISLLALIILLENLQTVTFRLLFWKVEVSQLLLVLLMLIIGYILGFLTAKISSKTE